MNPTTKGALSVLDQVKAILTEKEKGYGDAAKRVQVFSKADAEEMIRSRVDNKLERIKNLGTDTLDEDTLLDLVGYLALLASIRNQKKGCQHTAAVDGLLGRKCVDCGAKV